MKKTKEDMQSEILSAISHPNRIRILKSLRKKILCNCELMPLLGLEQSNLSRHLKSLENAGIIVSWKEGLRVNYKVTDIKIFDILDIAEKVVGQKIKNLRKIKF
ncbi:MAG: metalloregulator ArsR/SmtB family transcription factor [bacterium]